MFYIEANDNVIAVFLKCYFIDFLWGISLAFALNSVAYSFANKKIIINCFVTFLLGLLFEFAQLADIIRGTFDFVDIIMYAFAALISAAININIFKE